MFRLTRGLVKEPIQWFLHQNVVNSINPDQTALVCLLVWAFASCQSSKNNSIVQSSSSGGPMHKWMNLVLQFAPSYRNINTGQLLPTSTCQ